MGWFRVSVERTLTALQALALCCLLTAAALQLFDPARSGDGLPVAVVWLVLVPIIAALWALRPRIIRTGHGIAWTMLTVLLATPIAVFGSLGFTIPVLLLVVAFAVVDVSVTAGVCAAAWISCVGFALHVLGSVGSPSGFLSGAALGIFNVVPVAVLLTFGIGLGLSLRSFEDRRLKDRQVIDRLRQAAELEKELLLSDERARSARELHDGLGHRLTLVSMSLELAERMRRTDPDQADLEIRTAREAAGDALAEMRMWVRALSPVRATGAHGLAALELIAESFRGTGLRVHVSGDDASDHILTGNDAVALLMYRAVQEGLTNALRHSRARSVRIDLTVQAQRIQLAVVNDLGLGVCAEPAAGEPAFGFGLRGLSERAAEHGGDVLARWVNGEFRLDVAVPFMGQVLHCREEDR